MRDWDDFKPSDVPDEIQHRLLAIKEQDHKDQFEIGRNIVAMRAALEAERLRVPVMRLYKAAGYWSGCSSEHARQCYQVAKNVTASLERQYPEISFHLWKALVPWCDTPGEYHDKIKEWMEHCEETGVSPTSVDGIRGWLNPGTPEELAIQRYGRLVQNIDRSGSDLLVPEQIRRVLKYTIQELNSTVTVNNLTAWRVEL
jgi:hypothetical protein